MCKSRSTSPAPNRVTALSFFIHKKYKQRSKSKQRNSHFILPLVVPAKAIVLVSKPFGRQQSKQKKVTYFASPLIVLLPTTKFCHSDCTTQSSLFHPKHHVRSHHVTHYNAFLRTSPRIGTFQVRGHLLRPLLLATTTTHPFVLVSRTLPHNLSGRSSDKVPAIIFLDTHQR